MKITINEFGFPFAELTQEQKDMMTSLKVGKLFIEKEQIKEVQEKLNLIELDEIELRAMRNSVVEYLSDKKAEERNGKECNWDRFDQLSNNISGITAVIDQRMFQLNPQSV